MNKQQQLGRNVYFYISKNGQEVKQKFMNKQYQTQNTADWAKIMMAFHQQNKWKFKNMYTAMVHS